MTNIRKLELENKNYMELTLEFGFGTNREELEYVVNLMRKIDTEAVDDLGKALLNKNLDKCKCK